MSAKGHRVFAAVYDRLNAGAERTWLGKRRADLVARATGQVLEVGAGTGANLVPRQATFARNETARTASSSLFRFRQAM